MKRTTFLCLFSLALNIMNTNASSLYDIPLKDINGKDASLKAYEGKVLLMLNVASKCGLTPQYQALCKWRSKSAAGGGPLVKHSWLLDTEIV